MRDMRRKNWFFGLAMAAAFWTVGARANDPVNTAFVNTEIYLWNRLADFTEIARGGVAGGPCIGAELAITDKCQFGAYTAKERGATLPFLGLWILSYLDDQDIFMTHRGAYKTKVFFNKERWETTPLEDVRFPRGPWDVRAQVAAGIVHLYLSIESMQVMDFFAGLVCMDPLGDDQVRDPTYPREPARQLGRGAVNIVCGPLEIPINMNTVNGEKGGFAAITYGAARGVWRSLIRISVGAVEVVTFPMGWEPIIEPEFPFEPTKSTLWRVSQPAFRRQY